MKNSLKLLIYNPATEIGGLDTFTGKALGSVFVIMVERYSRSKIIAKVPRRTTVDVSIAIMTRLVQYRDKLYIFTFSNSKEFSAHATCGKGF